MSNEPTETKEEKRMRKAGGIGGKIWRTFLMIGKQIVIKFSKQLKRQPIQASITFTLLID